MRYLGKPILSSAIMALFLIFFAIFHPIVNILIAGTLYLIAMLLMGGFTKEEFFLLKTQVLLYLYDIFGPATKLSTPSSFTIIAAK